MGIYLSSTPCRGTPTGMYAASSSGWTKLIWRLCPASLAISTEAAAIVALTCLACGAHRFFVTLAACQSTAQKAALWRVS